MSINVNLESLLIIYQDYNTVYGPYIRKDGRMHVVLYNSNFPKMKKITISYPKALVECLLLRRLLPNETIDHYNGDYTDNRFDNLLILDRKEHISLDSLRVKFSVTKCIYCNKEFIPTHKHLQREDTAGPFCSRRCSGLYGKDIQNNLPKLGRIPIEKTYYKSKYDF